MPEAAIQFTYDQAQARDLARRFKRIQSQELRGQLQSLFVQLAARAARWIRRTQLHHQTLRERSSNLAKSIEGKVEIVGNLPALRVGVFSGPALNYAGVQEFGTRVRNPNSPYDSITPRNGRALAMPTGFALDAKGVPVVAGPRSWPRRLKFVPFRGKGNTRVVGGLFDKTLKNRGTVPFAPEAIKGHRDPTLVFLLFSRVEISPHWYLRNGMQTFIPEIVQGLQGMLDEQTGAR